MSSNPRLYPLCPVVLVDERDPSFPAYPMGIGAVRHMFEELAHRVPPEHLTQMVEVVELGGRVDIPDSGVAIERLREARRIWLERRGIRWCPDHGTQPIPAAPETT